jgi:hypothetical protein
MPGPPIDGRSPSVTARVRRIRTLAVAAGLSTLLALLTFGTALADGGTGPWPK